MKNIFILSCLISLISCSEPIQKNTSFTNEVSITTIVNSTWNIIQLKNHELGLKSRSSIENIQSTCAILFVIFLVLSIVITPVLLVYNWAVNYYDYIRKYKGMDIGKYGPHKAIEKWKKYKRIYSDMSGFGYGLLAYNVSAFGYMFFYFDNISEGFLYYINFPFKVYNNLSNAMNPNTSLISAEVWLQMILIIGISLLAFILGKILGIYNVNQRYPKPAHLSSAAEI